MNPQDVFYVGKYVQIMYSSINNSKIYLKLAKPIDSMGQIWTAYLLCTRITLETTALRVMYGAQRSLFFFVVVCFLFFSFVFFNKRA